MGIALWVCRNGQDLPAGELSYKRRVVAQRRGRRVGYDMTIGERGVELGDDEQVVEFVGVRPRVEKRADLAVGELS